MKQYKIGLLILSLLASTALWAQNEFDALRYSKLQYEGTARTLGMGNAFTALGGDLGAISLNPAATAIFHHSSFTITPSLNISGEQANYLDNPSKTTNSRFGISNVGYVAYYPTGRKQGLINFNFAVVSNQIANYNGINAATGINNQQSLLGAIANNVRGVNPDRLTITDQQSPFGNIADLYIQAYNCYLIDPLVDENNQFTGECIGATEIINDQGQRVLAAPVQQRYERYSAGYNNDIAFSMGGNINHKFFFGINLSIQSIWYQSAEYTQENALHENDFPETGFQSMRHSYHLSGSGTGFNARAGIIWLPIRGLRLGASVATPTWIRMQERWYYTMDSQLKQAYYCDSPDYAYNYGIRSPWRWNIGAAYTFGSRGLISVDYENVNYGNIEMSYNGAASWFKEENGRIQRNFCNVNIVRAGAEYRITEAWSARAGYNYYSRSTLDWNDALHLASVGAGYSNGPFFADLAYQHPLQWQEETFSFFPNGNNNPMVESKYRNIRLLLTVGLRF